MIELRNENEEYVAFTQYLHLVRQRDDMERQQIYFRGHTDAVAYLKKIKAIWQHAPSWWCKGDLWLLKCNEQYIQFTINEPTYMRDAYRQENVLCYKLFEK